MESSSVTSNSIKSFPEGRITTELIQQHLEENKQLILAILENQNLGNLTECARYQARLQQNLMYLAAVADSQPPAPEAPMHSPQESSYQSDSGITQGSTVYHSNSLQDQWHSGGSNNGFLK